MKRNDFDFVALEDLRIGLFVDLDLGWMAHPFATSRFKISSAGHYMYIYQCSECHLRVGLWLKKSCLDGQRATPFDVEAENATRQRVWEARGREWRSRYETHLRSDKWRELCRQL